MHQTRADERLRNTVQMGIRVSCTCRSRMYVSRLNPLSHRCPQKNCRYETDIPKLVNAHHRHRHNQLPEIGLTWEDLHSTWHTKSVAIHWQPDYIKEAEAAQPQQRASINSHYASAGSQTAGDKSVEEQMASMQRKIADLRGKVFRYGHEPQLYDPSYRISPRAWRRGESYASSTGSDSSTYSLRIDPAEQLRTKLERELRDSRRDSYRRKYDRKLYEYLAAERPTERRRKHAERSESSVEGSRSSRRRERERRDHRPRHRDSHRREKQHYPSSESSASAQRRRPHGSTYGWPAMSHGSAYYPQAPVFPAVGGQPVPYMPLPTAYPMAGVPGYYNPYQAYPYLGYPAQRRSKRRDR